MSIATSLQIWLKVIQFGQNMELFLSHIRQHFEQNVFQMFAIFCYCIWALIRGYFVSPEFVRIFKSEHIRSMSSIGRRSKDEIADNLKLPPRMNSIAFLDEASNEVVEREKQEWKLEWPTCLQHDVTFQTVRGITVLCYIRKNYLMPVISCLTSLSF